MLFTHYDTQRNVSIKKYPLYMLIPQTNVDQLIMFLNAKTNFQVKYHEFTAPFRISNLLELQVKVCIAAKTKGMDTTGLRRYKEKTWKINCFNFMKIESIMQ